MVIGVLSNRVRRAPVIEITAATINVEFKPFVFVLMIGPRRAAAP